MLLAAIAAGLWFNLATTLLKPSTGNAQGAMEMYVAAIYNGTCVNHKIC
jgi:hypothetical protein